MKKKLLGETLLLCTIFLVGCTRDEQPSSSDKSGITAMSTASSRSVKKTQKDLGALNPAEALDYIQSTNDLIIIDVATKQGFADEHYEGAINIPIEELDKDQEDYLILKIPSGKPVLLHCRQGIIVPAAYERVKELRPDIPEIAYIKGAPVFKEE